jgi:hypothetical protein
MGTTRISLRWWPGFLVDIDPITRNSIPVDYGLTFNIPIQTLIQTLRWKLMFVNGLPENLSSTYSFRDPRNSFAESPPINDFVHPFLVQKKCEVGMPVASRDFLAAVSHVKYIESDLAHITWRFWVVEHVKLVQVRLLAIRERQIAQPEIKLDFFHKLQVL